MRFTIQVAISIIRAHEDLAIVPMFLKITREIFNDIKSLILLQFLTVINTLSLLVTLPLGLIMLTSMTLRKLVSLMLPKAEESYPHS